MSNFPALAELEDSISRYIQDSNPTEQDIFDKFVSKIYPKSIVKAHIKALEKGRDYIRLSNEPILKPGVYMDFEAKKSDFEHIYEITALGKSYLARSTANFTSFSNISNSNIAHQSPNTKQIINITEQPQDIQEKIKELELAIIKKDKSALKDAFSYIADKSVDVAIALVAGSILRGV